MKVWIVKSGNWYLSDGCWFRKQCMAELFFDRVDASGAAGRAALEGYDARVIRFIPKAVGTCSKF